ncbi:MAG: peptide/nickel transport system substrate-binding protein [Chlorobi bacterium OLB7]|nr:MAG: peptide/nickel transport system substrate-binding protein [Chlorobi bacterium OLB7]
MLLKLNRSLTLLLLAALAISAGVGGCGGETRRSGNVFYYNEQDGLTALDPARIGARASGWIGAQIFSGLVTLDTALRPVPQLAKSWSVSPDGLRWTFHLRTDARFADDPCFPDGKGRRVTAQDVRYSFERVCSPESKSTGTWVFRDKVNGAAAFIDAEPGKRPAHIEGIRVMDDSTMEIELTQPFAPFLTLLSIPYAYVVPHEAVEKYGEDFFRHPVGSGPFKLKEWNPDQFLTLERNPNYFERDAEGKQLPYLDGVQVSFIKDINTEFVEFEQGNLDMVSSIAPTRVDVVLSDDGLRLKEGYQQYRYFRVPALSTEYYGFQLDTASEGGKASPLASNRYLRLALNYGIDREAIIKYVLKGQATAGSYGPIPPGAPGFSGVQGYRYDRELAKRMLDSAGFPGGKNLPPILLQTGTNERTASVAEVVIEQLKAIGVTVTTKQVEFAQLREMYKSAKVPFWRASWIADYPDGENFMALFYSPFIQHQGPNTTHFRNPMVDSLYRQALDPHLTTEQRAAMYSKAERLILDEAPWIILSYSILQRLSQPWIAGYTVDPLDRLVLTTVRKQQS